MSNVTEPAQIAVDGTSIYWVAGDASNHAATVNKANLDGSSATAIASGLNPDQDTRLVVVSGTVYWGGSDGIRSAGSSSSTLLVPTSGAALLAADSSGVYWRQINVNTFGYL